MTLSDVLSNTGKGELIEKIVAIIQVEGRIVAKIYSQIFDKAVKYVIIFIAMVYKLYDRLELRTRTVSICAYQVKGTRYADP